MTHGTWWKLVGVAALTGLAAVGTATAQDSQCEQDADCDAGYVCEEFSGGACPAIDCAEGDDCDLPACEVTTFNSCVPAPCERDADCGDSQVCHTVEYSQCSGGGACLETPDGKEICEEIEPECTTTTESTCTPRWAVPCEATADCGPGFTCEAIEYCQCSGGSPGIGAACADGDEECQARAEAEAAVETEPVCECFPGEDMHCEPTLEPCGDDADCGAGLTCQDNPNRGVCQGAGSSAVAGGGVDGGVPDPADLPAMPAEDGAGSDTPAGDAPDADGDDAVTVDCPGSDAPERVCLPPDYFAGYGYGHDLAYDVAAASGSAGGESGAPTIDREDSDEGLAKAGDGKTGDTVGLCTAARPGGRGPLGTLSLLLGATALLWARRRRQA